MNLIEKVEERLSIFKNLYDNIRIVDPINKKTILVKSNEDEETNSDCYSLWNKHTFCENCISMSAYINKDTFVKIEYDKEKITLITAALIEVDGNMFIAEILKDITKNGSVLNKTTGESCFLEEIINSINEKAVKDKYSVTDYNIHIPELLSKVDKNLHKVKMYDNDRTIVNQERVIGAVSIKSGGNNIKLKRLNEQITQMREVLNEICCTLDDDETKSKRLNVSQCLDELIVEYMKELNNYN